jgi:hypothetical protein
MSIRAAQMALTIPLLMCVALLARTQVQNIREDLYVTNGGVSAIVVSESTLYIGDFFSQVGPAESERDNRWCRERDY